MTVSTPALELRGVSKSFGGHKALDEVSLTVRPGTTVGLVGESGSGKSTLARLVLGLERPDSGQVLVAGSPLPRRGRRLRRFRSRIGLVLQDPYDSLDPRLTIGESVAQPLRAHGMWRSDGPARVRELLDAVGLDGARSDTLPSRLSGGQRQRVGVARALAADPELVICDEPTSALDVSVQAQILNLLLRLQRELGLSYLFISHDLGVVRRMSDDVVVLFRGQVMEHGPAGEVMGDPSHAYTQALVSSIPGSGRGAESLTPLFGRR